MGAFVAADIHLQASYSGGKGYEDHFTSLNRVFELAEQSEEATPVILAGDIFDTTKVTPTSLQKALEIFSQHPSVPIYFINGNHDPEDCNNTSWMKFCERAIELGPEKVTLPDGLTIAGMSWRLNSRIPEYLNSVDKSVDCLFVHQFIEPTFSLDDEFQSIIQNALPSSLFKDFKAVIAGDIHKSQIYSASIPPLAYPGPTCPCNLKEVPGCFYISKTEEPGCTPFGNFFLKAIPLPERPIVKITVETLTTENQEEAINQLENLIASKIEQNGPLETGKPWLVLQVKTADAKVLEAISERFKQDGELLVRRKSEESQEEETEIEDCETLPSQSIADYIVSRLTYENISDTMRNQLTDLILHERKFFEDMQSKFGMEPI